MTDTDVQDATKETPADAAIDQQDAGPDDAPVGDGLGAVEIIAQRNVAVERVKELEAENAALTKERDALKAKLADAAKAVKVEAKAKAPGKARKWGLVADQPAREELLALIANAETVEVGFSDGVKEIIGLPVFETSGDAWAMSTNGVKLIPELALAGPAPGAGAYMVDGFALLIDGKQVAYSKRMDVLAIGPGMSIALRDDVIF